MTYWKMNDIFTSFTEREIIIVLLKIKCVCTISFAVIIYNFNKYTTWKSGFLFQRPINFLK